MSRADHPEGPSKQAEGKAPPRSTAAKSPTVGPINVEEAPLSKNELKAEDDAAHAIQSRTPHYRRYDRGGPGLYPEVDGATLKDALAVVDRLTARHPTIKNEEGSDGVRGQLVELISRYKAKRRRDSAVGDTEFRNDLKPLAKALKKLDAQLAASPKTLKRALEYETAIRLRRSRREQSGQIDAMHDLVRTHLNTAELLISEASTAGRPAHQALIDACGGAVALYAQVTSSKFPRNFKTAQGPRRTKAFESAPAHFVFELLHAVDPAVNVSQVKSALEASFKPPAD